MLTTLVLILILQPGSKPKAAVAQAPLRPDVRKLPYAVAESTLRALRITVVTRDSVIPGARPGLVIEQRPRAGTPVYPKSIDTLILTAKPPTTIALMRVDVPDVVGLSYAEAVRVLHGVRLFAEGPEVEPVDSVIGRVATQDPRAPGPAVVGSRVRLSIRIVGPTVPPVVGTEISHARALLERARLRSRVETPEFNDEIDSGLVFHQDPQAGDRVKPGATVVLRVSKGGHPDTTAVLMPRLYGLSVEDARAAVEKARLSLNHLDTVYSPGGKGRVVAQNPEPASRVHFGDAVSVTVQLQDQTAVVPPLIGRTRRDAEDTLKRLGLGAEPIRMVLDPGGPRDVVRKQSPLPGTRLRVGASVELEVTTRPDTVYVIVPQLVRLSLDAATRRIMSVPLTVRNIERRPGVEGIVLNQAPDSGTRVPKGSTIELTVGSGLQPPPPPSPAPPPLIPVPEVRESLSTAAPRILRDAGFTNVIMDSTRGIRGLGWKVSDQAPQAGIRVRSQTLIQLTLEPIPAIRVPVLFGRHPTEAGVVTSQAGLTMQVTGSSRGLRLRSVVLTQVPDSGTIVALGAPIQVTVGNPLPLAILALLAGLGLAVTAGVVFYPRPKPPGTTGPPDPPNPLKPTIQVEAGIGEPTLEGLGPDRRLLGTDVSWRVEVDWEPARVLEQGSLIDKEEAGYG